MKINFFDDQICKNLTNESTLFYWYQSGIVFQSESIFRSQDIFFQFDDI